MTIGAEDMHAADGAQAPTPDGEIKEAALLRAVCDGAPVGIYRADAEGRCTYVNARWCELTGLRVEDAMGAGWLRAIHPDDRQRVQHEWERTHREGWPFGCEYRYLRADGAAVWIYGLVRFEHGPNGERVGYVGCVADITEQRRMREEWRQTRFVLEATVAERTEKLYHTALAVEASGDAIVTADVEGHIVSWNKAAERMFGWSAGEMIGASTERITPPELWPEAQAIKRRVRAGERIEGYETIRRAKSGDAIEVSLNLFPLRDGRSRVIGTCAVVREMTELRKAERRLQRLSRRLLDAQDDERRRLARELHDSTGQSLVALSMNLAALAQAGAAFAPEKRDAILATCLELAEGVTRDLRTAVYLLHPPLLEDHGLSAALQWFIGGFQVRSGIETKLTVEMPIERLPYRCELALFRVAQESLSNVHRHSGSPTAHLDLRLEEGVVTLRIVDAGCGYSAETEGEIGVGISGMRERLAELGGSFTIAPSPPGTTATARVPIGLSTRPPQTTKPPATHE